ncbi:unnamed protein product [Ceutorhynchus assimilis]|uniref:Glucose-methanol-choline oxidoreductase N-terminal domain-containing protein n=1 Tax=Ceutorhynchus assimilis TaxID=467358 RepID=A0A9N9MGC9_9CUCU|nr:unnamed protein product [Ceutorhynchus assimilis]
MVNYCNLCYLVVIFLPLLSAFNLTEEFYLETYQILSGLGNYVLPVNNDEYFPMEETDEKTNATNWNGNFDFIIIGGGTAGGVIANRLTEENNYKVLIIEAGHPYPDPAAVLGLHPYFIFTKYNWGYNTTEQKNACLGSINDRCMCPRGKVLGGTSVINGGIYSRGSAGDFNFWEAIGNVGWGYDDVLPYFKKSEKCQIDRDLLDQDFHGFDGLQATGMAEDTPILTEAILEAFNEIGMPTLDYNGESSVGISRMQLYLDRSFRTDTAYAYLKSILDRVNLHIIYHALVTKIRFDGNTARGVEFMKDGILYFASAKKEVILSAGAINSPQLLMLSGIGPAQELRKHGIKCIKNSPNVGRNLMDHMIFPGLAYQINSSYYDNVTLEESLQLWTEGKRPLNSGAASGGEVIGFLKLSNDSYERPDCEIFVIGPPSVGGLLGTMLGYDDFYAPLLGSLDPSKTILVGVVVAHPSSRGTVKLTSNDPRDYPSIDTNFFSTSDLQTMNSCTQKALQVTSTQGFQKIGAQLIPMPIPECDDVFQQYSEDWWHCAFKVLSVTFYHHSGTTRMGKSITDSVVDSNLKVHGIEKFRVVDAGVIPELICGHTNAAVVMIAEKIADEIKREHKAPSPRSQ